MTNPPLESEEEIKQALRHHICKQYTKPYDEMREELRTEIDKYVNLIAPFIKSHTNQEALKLLDRLESKIDWAAKMYVNKEDIYGAVSALDIEVERARYE